MKTSSKEKNKGRSWREAYQTGYDEASKAFGNCKLCYGKGYTTQLMSGKVQMNTCVCDRGKQLDILLLDNAVELIHASAS